MLVWVYKCFYELLNNFHLADWWYLFYDKMVLRNFFVCLCWSNDKSYFISFFQLQKISILLLILLLILTEISKKILDKEVAMVKWQDNSEDFLQKLKVHCHNMIQREYFITEPWSIKYENEEKQFFFQPSFSSLSYHR